MSMVTIVDYGVGNLFNIQKAFKSIGAGSTISNDPEEMQVHLNWYFQELDLLKLG